MSSSCGELLDRRGSIHVGGNQVRMALPLRLEHARQLADRRRLTGTLQADHHDDDRRCRR
jgi:hypothetical protein